MVHAFVMTPHLGEADYHRVAAEVGDAPLDGVLLHLCVRGADGVQYVEVWESEADFVRAATEQPQKQVLCARSHHMNNTTDHYFSP